jgi:hypothetical protein
MIRLWAHELMLHRTSIPGRGYANFYHCWTCGKGWNGLFFRAGKHWTA